MGRPKEFDPDIAVDQAMEVFWRKGFASTTPQDLVDELGIGKGSLYNAFGSKQALFERALRRYRDVQVAALTEVLEQPGRPVKERIRTALEALVEADLADPGRRGCMAVNSAIEFGGVDKDVAEVVRDNADRAELAFRAAREEGQRAGEISPDVDARTTASLLLNTVFGMRVVGKTAEGPERLHRIVEAVLAPL